MENYEKFPKEWESEYLAGGFKDDELKIQIMHGIANVNIIKHYIDESKKFGKDFHLSGINTLEILYKIAKSINPKTSFLNNLELKLIKAVNSKQDICIKYKEDTKRYEADIYNEIMQEVPDFQTKFSLTEFQLQSKGDYNKDLFIALSLEKILGKFNLNVSPSILPIEILRRISQLCQGYVCNRWETTKDKIPTLIKKWQMEIFQEEIPEDRSEILAEINLKKIREFKDFEMMQYNFDYNLLTTKKEIFCSGKLKGVTSNSIAN